MTGKIKTYSKKSGYGTILSEKNEELNFHARDWESYNWILSIGLLVDFTLQKGTAKNISVNTNLSNINLYDVGLHTNKQIKDYFSVYYKIIIEYSDFLYKKEELDYIKIKRFLFTAYNNLSEIHTNFQNEKMKKLKKTINIVEKHYNSFKKDPKNLKEIHNTILLSKNRNFKDIKNQISSECFDFDSFKTEFRLAEESYNYSFVKILNSLAFELDNDIWVSANKSRMIKSFFLEAGISEHFSALVYLKYYLKSLNLKKANKDIPDLKKLMTYLKNKEEEKLTSKLSDNSNRKLSHSQQSLLKVKNKIPLFNRLNSKEVLLITKEVKFLKLPIEEVLIHQYDKGEEIYFILNGQFSIYVYNEQKDSNIEVAILKKDNIVGEFAPVIDQIRNATVIATKPSNILSFKIDYTKKIQHPQIYLKLYENFIDLMAKKLKQNNQTIQNLMLV